MKIGSVWRWHRYGEIITVLSEPLCIPSGERSPVVIGAQQLMPPHFYVICHRAPHMDIVFIATDNFASLIEILSE